MGHSQAEKAQTHARIVEIASQRFRESGIDGVSLADLMKEAGLTHGGFYRHFDSRDALVAEAVGHALTQSNGRLGGVTLAALIDYYLGPAHCANVADGCAIAALVADIGRSNETARTAYTVQVKCNLAGMTRMAPDGGRPQAINLLASLVGALSLARAVNDEALSAEILETVRETLKTSTTTSPSHR